MAEASISVIKPRDDRVMPKGNFSCHSFTEQGRENYEVIFRKRKRHQEISEEVEAMKTPKAHETAKVKDYCKDAADKVAPVEEEIEITAYDMMVEQGMEKS